MKNNFIDATLIRHEQIRMKILATKYVIIDDILYKRSFNGILLRCLHVEEIETTLEHAHGGHVEVISMGDQFMAS